MRRHSWLMAILLWAAVSTAVCQADDAPAFFRGLNLNGPPVTIDGRLWEGQESPHYKCRDNAFDNQSVSLIPPTDPERAKMIRSSRWGGNEVLLVDLPAGVYSILLYVWEDNNSERFSISVNGREVVNRYDSGAAGHWEKLGPWIAQPAGGEIRLTSRGGAANFSGIEIWTGKLTTKKDGQPVAALDPAGVKFFEQHIRPALVDHCYECHSSRAKNIGGELRLDTRSGWQVGGQSGPAIVPGDAKRSLLITAVRREDKDLQMPPKDALSPEVVSDFEKWVEMGAPDPRDDSELAVLWREALVAESKTRWAFTPPVDSPLPAVQHTAWPKNGVDHFILHRLEQQQLAPIGDADKRTLLRRVTFDLIGLPPTPEEVAAFVVDQSPEAFGRVVDRLLDSPHYGERWGRHWLDVVRYADTAGDNSDFPIPQMHQYRDWVIESFNRDLPFDQFVRQQLAGDLLPSADESQRRRQIVATGYIANARRFGSRVDDYPQHLTIEDTIDNLGRAFLGLTVNCARCHDHKFDPISTEDYYALYGIFNSTRYPWPGIELDQRQRDLVPLGSAAEVKQAREAHAAKQKELDEAVRSLEKQRDAASGDEKKKLAKQVDAARQNASEHGKMLLPLPMAYAVVESEHIQDANVQFKGDPTKTGPRTPRGFLAALGGQQLAAEDISSGRASLAEWIVDRRNPLTARVLVNRLWTQHFGRGLVATPNDFGKQGKPPTHPELLDWLARRLVEANWSIKSMHRLLLLSHTYQLAAIHDPTAIPGDPANDLLSGFRPRRLDAESIRDALFAWGGNLDRTPAGPHPFPPMKDWKFTQHNPFKAVYDSDRRSVYLMTQRTVRHPYLAIFDGPDPSVSTPLRLTSTTPLQALFLMNDRLVHQQAEKIADRLIRQESDEGSRIALAYELLFARPVAVEERQSAEQYLVQTRAALADAGTPGDRCSQAAWQSYVRSLLLVNELVYID